MLVACLDCGCHVFQESSSCPRCGQARAPASRTTAARMLGLALVGGTIQPRCGVTTSE